MAAEKDTPSILYTLSESQINFQEISIESRMLWLGNSQSFMFGVYSGVSLFKTSDQGLIHKAQMLLSVVPFLGLVLSIFTLLDIISSLVQMHKITQNYKQANHNSERESIFPLIYGTTADRFFQRIAAIASSILFIVIWGILAMYDHHLLKF